MAKKKTKKDTLNITPLSDRVVIRPQEHEEHVKSGIIIPETVSKEKPERGVVVAVGEGRTNDDGSVVPPSVSVGDTVLFSKFAPDEIKIDGEEYFILSESHILAIID